MRILLANEPATCRDAIAVTLRVLHDDIEVVDVPADDLDTCTAYLAPDLVICSRVSEVVEMRVRAWILLYPDLERRVEVTIDGTRTCYEDLELDGILEVIRGERLRALRQ